MTKVVCDFCGREITEPFVMTLLAPNGDCVYQHDLCHLCTALVKITKPGESNEQKIKEERENAS